MNRSISRPESSEVEADSQQARYIALVTQQNVLEALAQNKDRVIELFSSLSAQKLAHRYAPDKWSVQEVLGHLIDTERILFYRALCIARGEEQSLPGFNEAAYVQTADFSHRSLSSLLSEYQLQRATNLVMATELPEAGLKRLGRANERPVSSRALLWITAGHELHHLALLQTRYGIT